MNHITTLDPEASEGRSSLFDPNATWEPDPNEPPEGCLNCHWLLEYYGDGTVLCDTPDGDQRVYECFGSECPAWLLLC